ncbi:LysE family transporter [Myxococcota bacterium]|nr:LysE family transporter [Myxococcota bacterium]
MDQLWLTALLGFAMGFAGSIPLAGPTTMLVLSFGIQGRIREAGGVAAGAALPEAIYAGLALWGFGALIESFKWVGPLSRGFAILMLVAVGLFLILRPPTEGDESSQQISEKTSLIRSFLLGTSLTAFNPTLVLNWGAAVTMFYSLGALQPHPYFAVPFGIGAAGGIVSWFAIVIVVLSKHRRRISPQLRARLLRAMGIILIALAAVASVRTWLSGEFT